MGLFLSSMYMHVTLKCCTWRKNGNTQHFHDVPVVPLIKPIHHTFVQLVLIKRMMFNHNIKSGKKTSKTSSELDQTIKYYMYNVVNKTECQRYRWLLQLISKYSLKQYFDVFYTDSHCIMIDLIFKHIILTRYKSQYSKQIAVSQNTTPQNTMFNHFQYWYLINMI